MLSKSSSGQRTIDANSIPQDLSIENVEKRDDNTLRIKWNKGSNQEDSIFSLDFLINEYPSNMDDLKAKENVKRTKLAKVFTKKVYCKLKLIFQ